MASNNMYRVGDFVYFEVSAASPYQVRKIEELNKTSTGAVEAKVVCFYRRRDLSSNLIQLADKHQRERAGYGENVSPEILHQIRHRELFLSRHLETLPATHIRGKCNVSLHNETESCQDYLLKDDAFFFNLVYDPVQKTLQADQGVIRVGDQYQAQVPPCNPNYADDSVDRKMEELCWQPEHNLASEELDSYLLLTRSLATLGRAYHPPSALRHPSLVMSAAAAARDTTQQQAFDVLHSVNYDIPSALQALTPSGQPLLKLDEMEEWSASEGNLFEEALEKYGKCFYDIQSDFLPWKLPKSLIEFYYMWKTTDHYVQQKRMKAAEAEHRLKQVYIPNYNKPNPTVLYPPPGYTGVLANPPGCEGCPNISSTQWYALGPTACPLKVCSDCWAYWKRYGDLKASSLFEKVGDASTNGASSVASTSKGMRRCDDEPTAAIHRSPSIVPSNMISNDNPVTSPVSNATVAALTKSRGCVSFHFHVTAALQLARRLCPQLLHARRLARRPFKRITSLATLQKEAAPLLTGLTLAKVEQLTSKTASVTTSTALQTHHLHSLLGRVTTQKTVIDTVVDGSKDSLVPPSLAPSSFKLSNCNDHTSEVQTSNLVQKTVDSNKTSESSDAGSALLGLNGTIAPAVTSPRKRPVPERIKGNERTDFEDNPAKKPNLNKEKVRAQMTYSFPNSTLKGSSTVSTGPKRRSASGIGGSGAATLIYLATVSIKRRRRKLFPITEMRRLGRRPCSSRSNSSDTIRIVSANGKFTSDTCTAIAENSVNFNSTHSPRIHVHDTNKLTPSPTTHSA